MGKWQAAAEDDYNVVVCKRSVACWSRLRDRVSESSRRCFACASWERQSDGVLFYSMLEDGNEDDLNLHAALPVKEGENWLANFWVWDVHR